MRKVTLYVADDGTAFDNEPQCRMHDKKLSDNKTSYNESAEQYASSMRMGLDNIQSHINRLKSNTECCVCLKFLTRQMVDTRKKYKEQLAKSNGSVKSMLALGKVASAACDAYKAWDKAITELRSLRERVKIQKDSIRSLEGRVSKIGKKTAKKPVKKTTAKKASKKNTANKTKKVSATKKRGARK